MTTVKIDISDAQAAVLSAKAAELGLTLESWFRQVAEHEAGCAGVPTRPGQYASVVEEMRRLRASVEPDPEGWTTRDYVNYGRR